MGRRIYDNLKKAMMYTLSVHIPIAGMSLLPIVFKWPLALFPMQIVFLELIIDPACSIIFEAEKADKNIMKRPPRKLGEALFDRRTLFVSITQGLIVLSGAALVYWWILSSHEETAARAACFTVLVLGNIGLILANRSHSLGIFKTLRKPNKALWWVVGGALVLLACTITLDPIQKFFKFGDVALLDLVVCVLVAVSTIVIMELLRLRPGQKSQA